MVIQGCQIIYHRFYPKLRISTGLAPNAVLIPGTYTIKSNMKVSSATPQSMTVFTGEYIIDIFLSILIIMVISYIYMQIHLTIKQEQLLQSKKFKPISRQQSIEMKY